MKSFLVIATVSAIFSHATALTCYGGDDASMYHVEANEGYQCVSYKYTCVLTSGICSSTDVSNNAKKFTAMVAKQDACDTMKAYPEAYMDLKCCTTDLCNGEGAAAAETHGAAESHVTSDASAAPASNLQLILAGLAAYVML